MVGGILLHKKLALYVSITLLNAAALMALGLAFVLPALEPQPAAITPPPTVTTTQQPVPEKAATKQGIPVRVAVPSLGIDLPVQKGSYNASNDTWTLSHNSAYYATPTVPANNQRGTTLIYGHNTWNIFRKLHDLEPGAKLTVYTDTGFVFRYRFENEQQVVPENIRLLRGDGRPTVLLQTCSGVWSQHRKLFSFSLISVEKHRKPQNVNL